MTDKKMTQLADPQAAIASYLDELLHSATDLARQQEAQPEPAAARVVLAAASKPVVEEQSPARPEWAKTSFECLIFTVAGLQLAVPLVLLGAIHRIDNAVDPIRPMPGSPRWYMGVRAGSDKHLRVVNSAEWVMAGRAPVDARANYRFVIQLNNSDWGLACDNVAQSFTLSPQQVRWRSSRSKRPWLAGTVIEQMCALLDVQCMADLLARAEREQHLDLA